MNRKIINIILISVCIFGLFKLVSVSPEPIIVKLIVEDYNGLSWQGTGFFIEDNLIMTAGHIVKDANCIYIIKANNGSIFYATGYYKFTESDLGIIEVKTVEIEPKIKFCDAKLGEIVRSIGNPFGYFPVLNAGIVSAININSPMFGKVLITDCPLNPGNSGSPLLNSKNQVVGICVGGIMFANNIGFCIPAKTCKLLLEIYKENKRGTL